MRKFKIILSAILVFLPLFVYADNAGYSVTVPGYYRQNPTIDGSFADWPPGLTATQATWVHPSYTAPTGPSDFSMEFKAFFNPLSEKLYVAVTVVDDEERRTGTPGWLYDHLEMYIDGNHNHTGAYPGEFQQYLFNLDKTGGIYGAADFGETIWDYQKAATTYTFEIAFKIWDVYNTTPHDIESGQTIGYDISWPDQDDATGDSWIAWSPSGGKWNDPTLFGNMVFGAMQDTPPTAANNWLLYM